MWLTCGAHHGDGPDLNHTVDILLDKNSKDRNFQKTSLLIKKLCSIYSKT